VLKEAWEGCRQYPDDCNKPVSKYIQDLETNMHNAERYARQHAQQRYTKYHNITTKDKMFLVGDQVVVLEKDSTHKTFARWKQGKITKVRSPHSYMVEMANGSCKHLHVNKIKLFVARAQNVGIISEQDVRGGAIRPISGR